MNTKRRLLILNALLCGVLILGATQLYARWLQAEMRLAQLDLVAPDAVPPSSSEPRKRPAVRAGAYRAVVDRLLFSPDRNPTVEVEEPEVVVVQRPELPRLDGLVDFGDGPTALMAADATGKPEWLSVGGKVGEFVFNGVDGGKVKLLWKEEEILAAPKELVGAKAKQAAARSKPRARRPAAGQAAPTPAVPEANMAADVPKPIGGKHNIGTEFIPGRYRADPGDSSPDGTESGEYRKVVRPSPFGSQSWWEKK